MLKSINRSLLHWLKLWDYVVFGKDVPKPMKKGANKSKKDKEKEMNYKNKKFFSEVAEQLDKHHRPEQKVCNLRLNLNSVKNMDFLHNTSN